MEQVISVFAPIFAITLLGYICGRLKLLGDQGPKILSRFVFFVAMPPLIYVTLATRNLAEIVKWDYMLTYLSAIFCAALIYFACNKIFFKEKDAELALGIFTSVNGNAGYLGIPICMYAFGTPLPAVLATIIHMVCVYPTLLPWAELDLAKRNGEAKSTNVAEKLKQIFTVIIKNPVILATMLGVATVVIGIQLPTVIERTCHLLGNGAIPAAVFALGMTLADKSTDTSGAETPQIVFNSIIKLLVVPSLAFVFGRYVFNLNEVMLGTVIFVAAMPSPKNAFILAQTYGTYVRRAALSVMLTTIISGVTLPFILYAFDGLRSAP